ncbi:MAG: histidine kinase [Flavobacteriaceae bacterium]|nr:MAG: histidine kinase [Flavobacteriaceae bacterium]
MIATPNLHYIEEISENDIPFQRKLIAIIKEEFPKEKESFLKNIHLKEFHAASENIHKLKHKINLFGMNEGYLIANQMEIELREKKLNSYPQLLTVLLTVESFLKQI